jgi:hypothetical protein
MKTYNIHFTQKADDDILYLYDYIAYQLAMPDTAFKYFKGMFAAINKLRITGASYAFSCSGLFYSVHFATSTIPDWRNLLRDTTFFFILSFIFLLYYNSGHSLLRFYGRTA